MERRRTDQFLNYALGARSPGKKKYFRSKLFHNPQEMKLKFVKKDSLLEDEVKERPEYKRQIKDRTYNLRVRTQGNPPNQQDAMSK